MVTKSAQRRQVVEDALQKVNRLRQMGRRTYLGLWGLAFDQVATGAFMVAQQGIQFSQRAEERGLEVEQTLQTQLGEWERQVVSGLVWLRERLDEQLPPASATVATHTPPSPIIAAAAPAPSNPGQSGTLFVDSVAAQRVIAPLPLANYDQLMAKQVIDQLERLTVDELNAVQVYEQQHRARITVLRAIEQILRRKLAIV